MKNLDIIGDDLFNKIRGRFKNVTIGDAQGQITNEPAKARFFDFEYTEGNAKGKVSVSISEDEGLTVIYSNDFIANESDTVKNNWYNFLKELRVFARKRLLNFDTRDITKTNLNKRDYKFLANNRAGDGTMTESKLYGTSRISYQNVGEARIMIRHTENINQETATGRTQKIGKIYIESADGERFRYPYKHLSGARAMARHVAEGGNTYDDFGKHIVGLSEEMSKLRKFKNYMGRSAVMAESLAGYTDIVKERITTVKKTIESLQKPAYYKEAFEAFTPPVLEDVPSDVAENWIDELTIRQFNEELQDIFPYIYNLVKEGTKVVELGPDELEEVAGPKDCWDGYKKDGTKPGTGKNKGKRVNNCVKEDEVDESGLQYHTGVKKHGKEYMDKAAAAGRDGASQEELGRLKDKYSKAEKNKKTKEEIQLEQGFEEMMGQFGEDADPIMSMIAKFEDDMDRELRYYGSVDAAKVGMLLKQGKVEDAAGEMADAMTDQDGGSDKFDIVMQTAQDYIEDYMGQFGEEVAESASDCDHTCPKSCPDCGGTGNPEFSKEKPTNEEMDSDVVQAWYSKYKNERPYEGRDLAQGFFNYYLDSGVPTDAMERSECKALMKKFGQDEFMQDPFGAMKKSPELAPISNAMHAQFAKIVGKENPEEEDVEQASAIINNTDEGNAYAHAVKKAKMNGKKKGDKIQGPDGDEITLEKDKKTPLGEFILSYFDRETGQFPKGETAILTMIEKDYGEQYISPAKQFIEMINNKVAEMYGYKESDQPESELDRLIHLATF